MNARKQFAEHMNARKQFAEHLRGLSDDALLKKQLQTESAYVTARSRGDETMATFLYFDISQIAKEITRRFEKEKTI